MGALGPDDYVRFVAPYSRALIERIRAAGVPVIHFGTGAAGFFRELHAAGGDDMGVDWRINIDQAWMDISYRSAVQGNLDPSVLFAPLPELRMWVHELLKRTGSRPGHIFNLGHGILPETPVDRRRRPVLKSSENSNSKRVVVVGGGIAGLSAAYDLKRAGIECTVFEKRPRLGGVIETCKWEGCTIDAGPDSFISAKPEAMALCKELGLESEIIGSNDHQRITFIQKHGKLVALPDGVMMIVPSKVMPMVKSPLLSWATKIRMGFELLRQPPKSPSPDRSVAEFVIDHFGQETLDYLAEPLLSGVYGGDPASLSVASILPRFVDMETKHGSLGRAVMTAKRPPSGGSLFRSLKSGMSTMVEKVACGLDVRNASVETIERNGNFRVRAGGEWVEASDVILACPAWSAAQMLVDAEPAFGEAAERNPVQFVLDAHFDLRCREVRRPSRGLRLPGAETRTETRRRSDFRRHQIPVPRAGQSNRPPPVHGRGKR